jgi:hypothetical protein
MRKFSVALIVAMMLVAAPAFAAGRGGHGGHGGGHPGGHGGIHVSGHGHDWHGDHHRHGLPFFRF